MGEQSFSLVPLWQNDLAPLERPRLADNRTADVAIIGAGMAGLQVAYQLARLGLQVVVLEKGTVACGESARTTAHLASVIDDRFVEMERLHGARGAQLAAQSHAAAIHELERICIEHAIACDFFRVDGYLCLAPHAPAALLIDELAAAQRAGLWDARHLTCHRLGNFELGPCLLFPRQGQFHPGKFYSAFAREVLKLGVEIYEHTSVTDFSGGGGAYVDTAGGYRVTAGSLVFATNSPVNSRVAIHTKQAAYQTYVISGRVPAGLIPRALYWDTADPYHYIRTQLTADPAWVQLIIGGDDHRTGEGGDTELHFASLAAWARQLFPKLTEIEYHWSGEVMETVDGLAYIGLMPGEENLYVVTGDSGMGMTHGTIAGLLLKDLIAGIPNAWTELYDPARGPRSGSEFLKEAGNSVAQYGSWLTPGDVGSADDVARGTGAVVRHGLTKHAVYRDEDGVLHEMSAVCPHLGCIVRWNQTERTWDCPCHGSRFSAVGEVLHGPAISALKSVEPVR